MADFVRNHAQVIAACDFFVVVTPWVKRAAQRVEQWTILDDNYAAGEFRLRLHGWDVERRFVVIREQMREGRDSLGRKLIEVPGYTFRALTGGSVASCAMRFE